MLQIAEGVSQDVTYGDIFTVYGGSVATGAMVWGILEGGSELAGSSWLAYNADQFLIGIADASGQGAGPGTFAGDPSLGYLLGYFVGSLSWWIQGPGSGGGIPP